MKKKKTEKIFKKIQFPSVGGKKTGVSVFEEGYLSLSVLGGFLQKLVAEPFFCFCRCLLFLLEEKEIFRENSPTIPGN